jgi:hypothetical protein
MYQLVFHLVFKEDFGSVGTDFTLLTAKSKDRQLVPHPRTGLRKGICPAPQRMMPW